MYKRPKMIRSLSMVLITAMLATALSETVISVDAAESVDMETAFADILSSIEDEMVADVSNGDIRDGNLADETTRNGNEISEVIEIAEETAEIVASKTVNGCTWTLDTEGKLFVRDSEGEAGESGDWGFCDYKDQIKTVDMDISKGTYLSSMFPECTNLVTAKIKIGKCEGSTNRMFAGCSSLTTLDLSGFDTQNVIDMSEMFRDCSSLTALDLRGVDTKNVIYMGWMFSGCSSLTSLDLSGFNTKNVTNMGRMFDGCSSLTSLDLSGFDTQNVIDMWSMFSNCSSLTSLDLSGFDTQNVTSMVCMFAGCSNLTSLNLSEFDTKNVTAMSSMFVGCSSLTTLDISGFDTQNVTYMGGMFSGCSSLTNLDLSGLDTQNVTDMVLMFAGCSNLTSLDISGFNTQNVTRMSSMFSGCSSLTSLDLSGLDTHNVTDMEGMFSECSSLASLNLSGLDTHNVINMHWMFSRSGSLTSLDLSGFDTHNVTDMSYMFYKCNSLTSLDISGFNTQNVTNVDFMFSECSSLISLDISGFNMKNVTSMYHMFSECSSLTTLELSGFDTKNVTDMGKLFSNCSSLTSLDLSGLDTHNVTNMNYMFQNCTSLTSLDISGFDTQKVIRMSSMFSGCSSLTNLDISGFDTQNVTDMSSMFSNCSSLTNLDISGFDTQNVTDMNSMFSNCSSLISLDISGFDTQNVTDMNSMFSNCSSLTNLDISEFDTQNVTDMNSVFSNCSSLTNLDISGFDTQNVTDMGSMFGNCSNLTTLNLGRLATHNVMYMGSMFLNCSNLTCLDISGFDTQNVIRMSNMFSNCSSLICLDISGLETHNVIYMSEMFSGCSSLTSLDISGFDTQNVEYMYGMFSGCSSLTSLDISGLATQNVTDIENMFEDCSNLKSIKTFKNLKITVKLPYIQMYDENGKSYTEFPKSLEEGIWLTKEVLKVPAFSKESYNVMVGLTCQLTLADLPEGVDVSDFTFASSDTKVCTVDEKGQVTGIGAGEATVSASNGKYTITCTVTVFKQDLFVAGIKDVTYTGSAIKPEILIYDGGKLLTEGVDYTLSYANNILAADKDSTKAPKVTVTRKGNYSGKVEKTFTILPYDIKAGGVCVSLPQSVLVANNKVQKPVPVVTFNGKKLTANKDYTVSYPQLAEEGAYKNPGTYDVEVTFKNNFTGTKTVKIEIKEGTSIAKVKVGAIAKMPYTGEGITPKPVITMGTKTLEEGTDYSLTYDKNIFPGKATVKISGKGVYVGERSVTFEITGIPIGKAQVTGLVDKPYNGKLQVQDLKVSLDNGTTFLTEYVDYKVVYEKNLNAGTAKVKIIGVGGYVGTINKSFRITAYNIKTDANKSLTGIPENLVVSYLKGGCKPAVSVAFNGLVLDQKKECSISYTNNTKLGKASDTKAPSITIKGKGNFTGTITIPFTIVANDLSAEDTSVKLTVSDVAFVNKAGKYISAPVLVDRDGKKLVAGKDYEKTIVYSMGDKELNPKTDIVPVGSEVTVTVTGKGFYTGTIRATYRITEKSFASAKIKINKKAYTGKPVQLTAEDIKVVIGKDTLVYGVDYEVDEDSYVNNVAKGNATVIIKGKGNYGGTKIVKFAIIPKGIP